MKPLALLRIAAGRSQREAAEIVGRTQQFVSACERGIRRMDPDTETRLREVLNRFATERAGNETLRRIGALTIELHALIRERERVARVDAP